MKRIAILFITLLLIASSAVSGLSMITATKASPSITAFFDDLTGFNAAAVSPPIVVDFDDITPNTTITDLIIQGMTFELGNQPAPSAPLIVVRANETYTPYPEASPDDRLFATSGENVLSPGGIRLSNGPNSLIENDDLAITLSTPTFAIGFDILYQQLDGYSNTRITLLDAVGNTLYNSSGSIPIPGGGGSNGGTTFVGFVSDSRNIAKIIVDERDGDDTYFDANIGFDTIRAHALVGGISLPVDKLELLAPYIGLTMLLAAAAVTVVYVKKRKRNTEIIS